MATQSQRRAATREALLKAAGKLFQKQGFDETAVEDITSAANVAKGTFYQHFDTKSDVLLALIRVQQAATLAEIEERLKQGIPPLEMGRMLFRAMAEDCEKQRKVLVRTMTLALERPAAKGEPSTRMAFARIFSEAQRRGDMRSDVDAYDLALTLVAGMVPAAIGWANGGKQGELVDMMEKAWRIFLEGAGSRGKDLA